MRRSCHVEVGPRSRTVARAMTILCTLGVAAAGCQDGGADLTSPPVLAEVLQAECLSALPGPGGVRRHGTRGNDLLIGTAGDDVLDGLGGDDVVDGAGGHDFLCGGLGRDVLIGDGDDILRSGGGIDTCVGQGGDCERSFSSLPLNTVGDAVQHEAKLSLTSSGWGKAGAAWLVPPRDVARGFAVTFQFRIDDPTGAGGDGFAFVIQNTGSSVLGGVGKGLGYQGIPNSLAIEFDTYSNPAGDFLQGDANDNHISVHTRGSEPNSADEAYSLGATQDIPNLSDGNVHTARVEYVPGVLRVYLDDLAHPALSVPVNLPNTLRLSNGQAFVGYTAATGAGVQVHDILSFSFQF